MRLKSPSTTLMIGVVFLTVVGCATTSSRNTPECKAFLLSEAERIEQQFNKTVEESSRELDAMFVPEHFGGNKDTALISKGAYIAFFNHKLKVPLFKVHAVPLAYKKAAQAKEYPKACDKMAEFRETNDKIIVIHSDMWGKALEAAAKFRQE